ncbi:MotA/TolQ/ExbB proton channel family protein [Saccharicrinis sp. FJH54]|uniref:MotA/TolQ/ExbB proton channel family protein n=1 Tax=Saccharicrinis sp. FJH54 TaxID=3344665 RepID=UPI0035D4A74D
MNSFLFMLAQTQGDMPVLTGDTTEEAAQTGISFFDLALKGGWIMIPIALLFIFALYIFFERFLVIKQKSKVDPGFMNRIKDYISDNKIDSAINLCEQTKTPVARMIEKGITRLGRPLEDVNAAIENVGNLEIAKMEKGLAFLATISGGAPMIGFLGTVIGMIRAFYDMANAGNNIDVGLLSNGIYTAMVTTVAGLIVGIIAYFAYNFLVARVDKVVHKMESSTMEFLDLLNEPA